VKNIFDAQSEGRGGMVRGSLDENGVAIRCVVEVGGGTGTTTLSQDVSVAVSTGVKRQILPMSHDLSKDNTIPCRGGGGNIPWWQQFGVERHSGVWTSRRRGGTLGNCREGVGAVVA